MSAPVFGVTGWKNSGKTTLLTRLVSVFVARGLRVSTIKHAHHAFDIDRPATDSFRHREAGASEVMIVSGTRWALMHELREEEEEPGFETVLPRLSPCDLVLVEGYKRERHPKIEVRRSASARQSSLALEDPTIRAIAADHPTDSHGLPCFALDDVEAMADFIANETGLRSGGG
ncbi:molybdopterin-guanine dinucleotide biosynthesis protein B [Propylenella binzhouense]|uniref:Molybdopterin-guanine dinucleotide biosynthesis protein B n=1 Tax=Propylenella binzhouense TaxID=2555902 RepID=A0A964T7P2_9HYPH|nr:molybdopterin-guanine dinucleotide biosynthesis protein B [Propylenella binzhouense]MYZ50023.1 molybdopterin-guanine dinucleotide biosynthesis protein B [Propylenella binzhouense]